MRIVTLMENTAVSPSVKCSHGLSFYIETKNHKILFDFGPDGSFLQNGEALGIHIREVDTAILSHGHYDHGGGLGDFLKANRTASVHMQRKAFGEFYAHDPDGVRRYIGLPQELKDHPKIVYHTGDYKLDAELQVFAGVTGRECYSPANDSLFQCVNGRDIQDLFMHEQNLLIKEGNKMVLIAGCAHNGIVNILKKAESFVPAGIDCVISGMHLKNAYPEEEKQRILCRKIAERLSGCKADFYTCHCTGLDNYEFLHQELGNKIRYLSAGSVLEI